MRISSSYRYTQHHWFFLKKNSKFSSQTRSSWHLIKNSETSTCFSMHCIHYNHRADFWEFPVATDAHRTVDHWFRTTKTLNSAHRHGALDHWWKFLIYQNVFWCIRKCSFVSEYDIAAASDQNSSGNSHEAGCCNTLQRTATPCNALQHFATHCNTLQHATAHVNTLQHTATLCNTLQHSATHRNTLH